MSMLTRNRLNFYKRTLEDIWSHYPFYGKPNKLMRFIKDKTEEKDVKVKHSKKDTDFIFNYKKKRKWNWEQEKRQRHNFVDPRVLKHYYFTLKMNHFKKFRLKAMKELGSYEENFLNFVEGRLFMLVYRSNFVTNMFMLKSLIELGIFTINYQRKYHPNVYAIPGDVICAIYPYWEFIREDIKMRWHNQMILKIAPPHLMISYKLTFSIYITKPLIDTMLFPFESFDAFLGVDYYQPRLT